VAVNFFSSQHSVVEARLQELSQPHGFIQNKETQTRAAGDFSPANIEQLKQYAPSPTTELRVSAAGKLYQIERTQNIFRRMLNALIWLCYDKWFEVPAAYRLRLHTTVNASVKQWFFTEVLKDIQAPMKFSSSILSQQNPNGKPTISDGLYLMRISPFKNFFRSLVKLNKHGLFMGTISPTDVSALETRFSSLETKLSEMSENKTSTVLPRLQEVGLWGTLISQYLFETNGDLRAFWVQNDGLYPRIH